MGCYGRWLCIEPNWVAYVLAPTDPTWSAKPGISFSTALHQVFERVKKQGCVVLLVKAGRKSIFFFVKKKNGMTFPSAKGEKSVLLKKMRKKRKSSVREKTHLRSKGR